MYFSRGRPEGAKYVFFFAGPAGRGQICIFFRAGPVPCMYFSREVPEGLILLHFVRVLEAPYGPTDGPCMYFFSRGQPARGAKYVFFFLAGPA